MPTHKVLVGAHVDVDREEVLLLERPLAASAAAGVAGRTDDFGGAGDALDGLNRQQALRILKPQAPGVVVLQVAPGQEQQGHLCTEENPALVMPDKIQHTCRA